MLVAFILKFKYLQHIKTECFVLKCENVNFDPKLKSTFICVDFNFNFEDCISVYRKFYSERNEEIYGIIDIHLFRV